MNNAMKQVIPETVMKIIIAAAVLLILSAPSPRCEGYYVFLLSEGNDPIVEKCFVYDLPIYSYYYFRMWIRSDPDKGLKGVEMGIDIDSADMVWGSSNPGIPRIIGEITSGAFGGAFDECQRDAWVWIARYECLYLGTPHCVYPVVNSDTGNFIVASCEQDYPIYELWEGSTFGVNMCCSCQDTESSSWGAVKAIYR